MIGEVLSHYKILEKLGSGGRVEGWRADVRVRWRIRGFHRGPQSGSHSHVSSPRPVKRSVRISRTPLSCTVHAEGYETLRSGRCCSRAG